MAINDLNRARKVYSFYRPQPVFASSAISGGGAGDSDVLIFNTIAELAAYDVLANALSRGRLGYVRSVRDYYLLENAVPGSGSPPLLNNTNTRVVAALNGDTTTGNWWFRLGLCGQQWEDQVNWHINTTAGSDENLGNNDNVPLKTLDELTLRLFATTVLKSTYNVYIKSTTGFPAQAQLGLFLQGENATVNMFGSGTTSIPGAIVSSSIGAISGGFTGSNSWISDWIPMVSGTWSATTNDNGALYISWDVGRPTETTTFAGWSLKRYTGKELFPTPPTASILYAGLAPVTSSLIKAYYPSIQTNDINVEGSCHLNFDKLSVEVPSSSDISLSTDKRAQVKFYQSQVSTAGVSGYVSGPASAFDGAINFNGGTFIFDHSRIFAKGSVGAPRKMINLNPGTNLALRKSGIAAYSATTIKLTDSCLEADDTTLASLTFSLTNAKVLLGNKDSTGAPVVPIVLCGSTFNLDSDTIVDVGAAMSPTFGGAISPMKFNLNNNDCIIMYDTTLIPSSGTIDFNTQYLSKAGITWAEVPVFDALSASRVIAGRLAWRIMPPDGGGGGGG